MLQRKTDATREQLIHLRLQHTSSCPLQSYRKTARSLAAHTRADRDADSDGWMLPVRPQRPCGAAAAPAPALKSGGAASRGHSVEFVSAGDTEKVSSGFFAHSPSLFHHWCLTCSSIPQERRLHHLHHHGKQSTTASSPAPGRGHRVPVP